MTIDPGWERALRSLCAALCVCTTVLSAGTTRAKASEPGEISAGESDATGTISPPTEAGRLRMAAELPEGTIFQGVIDTTEERMYLYRFPTRIERTRELVRAHSLSLESYSHRSPPLPFTERMRRHARRFVQTVRTSSPEHVFAGAFLFALTTMAGFGWMEQHRHTRRKRFKTALCRMLQPRRIPRPRQRNAFADSPAKWTDPWTPPATQETRKPDTSRPMLPLSLPALSGSIESVPLESMLQILSNANQTGALVINNANHECVGSFKFYKGRLVGVYCGKLTGEDAAYKLLSCEKGFYELRKIPISADSRTDGYDLMGLLMNAHRRIDEARAT